MRYIGCKKKLISEISSFVEEKTKDAKSFCDLFSGTSCVAKYFKQKYKIISNDLLYFSFVIQKTNIEQNSPPKFQKLKTSLNIASALDYLNDNKNIPKNLNGSIENNFSPKSKRLYFTTGNSKKIDFIRTTVETWKTSNLIDENEYFYLLSSLIEAVPFISNISGTYGAFNKFWDKRALNDLYLQEITIFDNKQENRCFNKNANELISEINGDILYLDPPYNSRQYISNYHVLETIAKYDFSDLKGITGVRNEPLKKSEYCSRKTAANALDNLLKNADFEHIILSYNTNGIISTETIKSILCDNGKPNTFCLKEIPYRQFKSNQSTNDRDLKELLFYIRK